MGTVMAKVEVLDNSSVATLLLPLLGLGVGVISYGQWWWTIGLSIAFPILLFKADTRLQAFLIALLYHMGATRSLALAAGRFYGDQIFFGVTIWALGNCINGLVYAAAWHWRPSVRLFTIPIGVLATALPPLGVLGWANPLTAAGVIFPGAGIAGFAYLCGLYVSLASKQRGFVKALGAISIWCLFTAKVPGSGPVAGMSTSFQKTDDGGIGDFGRQTELKQRVRSVGAQIILLPEGIVTGGWTEVGRRFWSKENRHVLLGAELKTGSPENVMVDTKSGVIYRQRQPIPFSMWRPFDSSGYPARWFDNPVMEVGDRKMAPLICYEGFLVWPIVHSYLAGATHIVATGNYWWAGKEQIPVIHRSVMTSWSRLFSIPYTMAVNL
jgi:hypothetical protein